MLKQFQLFYREKGLGKVNSLISPNLSDFVEFCRGSLLHYTPVVLNGGDNQELDASKLFFKYYNKRIPVHFVTQYIDAINEPNHRTYDVRTNSIDFFNKNKTQFKYVKDNNSVDFDLNTLEIFDYTKLEKFYNYQTNTLVNNYRFVNMYRTVFNEAKRLSTLTDRQQFIFIDIDTDIPSYSLLEIFKDKESLSMYNLFNEDYKRLIREIWIWLDPSTRSQSMLGILPDKLLSMFNIVFTNNRHDSAVLNLGYINSWIAGQPNTTAFASIQQLPYDQIKKVFMKFLINMTSFVNEEDVKALTEVTGVTANDNNTPINDGADDDIDHTDDRSVNLTSGKKDFISHKPITDKIGSFTKRDSFDLDDKSDENVVAPSSAIEDKLKDIDAELKEQARMEEIALREKGVVIDKDGGIVESTEHVPTLTPEELQLKFFTNKDEYSVLREKVDALSGDKFYSAADYRKTLKLIEESQQLPDPYNIKEKLVVSKVVKPEDIVIDEEKAKIASADVVDSIQPSMNSSTLNCYTSDYVEKVMRKDILSMVSSLQKSGVILKSYDVETEHTALGVYEYHSIELKPLDGVPSTIRIQIPKVDPDGSFLANGNKYVMRAQRVDLPIRKIEPSLVALTSYYGKTFVGLSEKKSDSFIAWLVKKLYSIRNEQPEIVRELAPANVYDNYNRAPFLYNALACHFRLIRVKDLIFNFNHVSVAEFCGEDLLKKKYEEEGLYICGMTAAGNFIALADNNHIWVEKDRKKNIWINTGSIFEFLDIEETSVPNDFSILKVFNKPVAVGAVLGFYMGLDNLLTFLVSKYQLRYRIVDGGRTKIALEPNEYVIKFADSVIVAEKDSKVATFILSGLNDYDKEIRKYARKEFNDKNVYFNLLKYRGLGVIYLRELTNLKDLFLDPITISILEDMKEPTTFEGLISRATELLTTYEYPDSQDTQYQRIRGYERFAGTIYKELATSIRAYRNKNVTGRSRIDMSHYQVWSSIMKDSANKIAEDINPLQNLKEQEIVTYVGNGGRDKDSLNKKSRAFHIKDMGVISEATVDSSDTGVNVYMSANPNLKSMRGTVDFEKDKVSSNLLSTSIMCSPGSMHDTAARVMFVSVQHAHTIAASGYHQPMVRTSYEYVVPHRTSSTFCTTAKEDGVVKSINDKGIVVQYKSGRLLGVKLGRVYGKAEGSIYPHNLVIMNGLKEGKSFKKGQVLAYNDGFFEPDMLEPDKVIMKSAMVINVALMESADCHEDSCSVSKRVSDLFTSKATYVKSVTLDFTQEINSVLPIGSKLDPTTVLMIIQDEITSGGGFSDEAIESLRRRSAQAPKAGHKGILEKIEVLYNGDKEDMTDSLRSLADKSDRDRAAECRSTLSPVITGEVNDDYRVSGVPLTLDRVEIKFYITSEYKAGVADKGVFCNQMKGTIGRVMMSPIKTKSGEVVDATFSYKSINKRMVLSPIIQGTTNTLLKAIAKKAYALN